MTSSQYLVRLAQDRFRWWANPPTASRPTLALAGWSLQEWILRAALVTPPSDLRFSKAYPAPLDVPKGVDIETIAREALRLLVLESEVEPMPGRPDTWRAVEGARRPA